jgi:hypothetical protein
MPEHVFCWVWGAWNSRNESGNPAFEGTRNTKLKREAKGQDEQVQKGVSIWDCGVQLAVFMLNLAGLRHVLKREGRHRELGHRFPCRHTSISVPGMLSFHQSSLDPVRVSLSWRYACVCSSFPSTFQSRLLIGLSQGLGLPSSQQPLNLLDFQPYGILLHALMIRVFA